MSCINAQKINKIKLWIYILILTFICSFSTSSIFAQTKLKIATLEYRPQIFYENNVITGICYDIIIEMAKRAEIQVDVEILPWKRALAMVERGKVDAVFPAGKTPEREKFGIYMSEFLYRSQYGLFVKKGNEFSFDKIEDLAGKKIGIPMGNTFTKEFEDAKKANLLVVDEGGIEVESNILKLNSNRFDVFIVNNMVGLDSIKRVNMLDKITILPKSLNQGNPQYLLFSKVSKIDKKNIIINLLDKVLSEMKSDGTYKSIIDKYTK